MWNFFDVPSPTRKSLERKLHGDRPSNAKAESRQPDKLHRNPSSGSQSGKTFSLRDKRSCARFNSSLHSTCFLLFHCLSPLYSTRFCPLSSLSVLPRVSLVTWRLSPHPHECVAGLVIDRLARRPFRSIRSTCFSRSTWFPRSPKSGIPRRPFTLHSTLLLASLDGVS